MNNNGSKPDARPDPKPRKNPQLWQSYLFWSELVDMRKRHLLRISSIEKGKSNLDAQLEYEFLDLLEIDELIKYANKTMINYGKLIPCWDFVTSIRGLKEGSLAAQLLAQIDDISKFDTVSKLWRFAGKAVIDGKAERNKPGEKSHFNRRLKSICYLISDQFIKQQTPVYVDLYYSEKERIRREYPEKIKNPDKSSRWPYAYTDSHVHRMARRKTEKIFLSHLWLVWREAEGLPVSKPYAEQILGHSNIIEPHAW
jgi:hypothetical protein